MGETIANNARGSIAEKIRNGADLIIVVLELAEADGTLNDYDDLTTLIAAVGNTEWGATGYARQVVLNAAATLTIDDGTDTVEVTFPNPEFGAIGPAGNDSVKALICEDGVTDDDRVVLTTHDWAVSPDGSAVVLTVPANGFWGSP